MHIDEVTHSRILFAALNWGSGHVSRSIGVLRQLKEQQNELFIAASSWQKDIFKVYLPDADYLELADYPFRFGSNGNFGTDLLKSAPELNAFRKFENKKVASWVKEFNIDLVLSDHRYGFKSVHVPSVFMCHQINLPVKGIGAFADRIHTNWMRTFNDIWVLDTDDSKFGGKLSQNHKDLPCTYIGARSRFEGHEGSAKSGKVLVLSGPSPYDQLLFDAVKDECSDVVVIGPARLKQHVGSDIDFRCGSWLELDEVMTQAEIILSRSGYSTIMDAFYLKAKLEMIPTPGQAEQKYLMKYWKDRSDFRD